MNRILALALASIQANMARLDRVAMNLANAQTTGYKREVAVTLPFAARVERGASEGIPVLAGDEGGQAVLASHVDQRPGALKATGQPLDLALTGTGWFEVQTEAGAAYTRRGDFRLDARGRIVTQQGHLVMGLAGEIQLTQGKPVIDSAGRVFDAGAAAQGGTPVAQLRIVQFEPSAQAERLGDGLVRLHGDALAGEGSAQVQQGFLENSNVQSMQEMVQLLQAVRHLESMQKVATSYDEMLGSSIRRLGEPS